jgi:hypothetical protein
MSTALLLIGCTALLVPCYARFGPVHPLTVTLLLWVGISVLIAIRPMNVMEPSPRAAVAIVLGLAVLTITPLVLDHRRRQGGGSGSSPDDPPVPLTVHVVPLAVASVVVLAAVAWGSLKYRSAISAALGVPFSQADPKLVRWAELYGNVSAGGTVGMALALAPLLGAFAVIGGLCLSRWWYLLLPVAVFVTMQSPSRTATLTVVVTAAFFQALLSRSPGVPGRRRSRPLSRWRAVALTAGVVVLGLLYFGFVGKQRDQTVLPSTLRVAAWVPHFLVEPLLYLLGGVSAFTVGLTEPLGDHGPYGEFGRSMYAVVRIGQLMGFHLPSPDPFAGYVDMPVSFNTYTAFGDAYFDFGLAGVLGVSLLAGLLVHLLHVWPRPGHPGSVWGMSVMGAVLTATPIHMRLLDLDILIPAVVGLLAIAAVLRPERGDVRRTGVLADPPWTARGRSRGAVGA